MKKTLTINISGIVFNIEEDAFEKLNNYIGLLENIFESQDGGQEILQDIESRIAELLQGKMTEGHGAVTSIRVDEVIQRMGTPEEMTDQEQTDNSGKNRSEIKQEKIKKRMYRDSESRVLGGVCSGMGAYFNFDPVFIRILFVLLAFLGAGISIIIYMILWIVVPEARTTAQRLEMRGEEATISNIRKTIQEEVKEVKESFSKMNQSETVQQGRKFAKKAADAISKIVVGTGKTVGVITGSLLVVLGLLGFIVVLISIFAGSSLLNNQAIDLHPEIDLPGMLGFMMSPGMVNVAILLMVLILGIPLLVILFVGTKLVFNYKTNNKMIGLGAFGIWLLALISMITLTAGQFGNFRQTNSTSEAKLIDKSNCKTLTIHCENNAGLSDDNIRINDFALISNGSEKIYAGNPHLVIEGTEATDFSVVVKKSARGNNSIDVQKNIENIRYKVLSKDSTLILDSFFTLENHAKWRDQEVKIIVKVPAGKMVQLDPGLDQLSFDFDNINNIWNKEMVGKTWIMTPEGLSVKK
jgi:phage shock protein PspC (stress-responsive transcriptional regulator)/ElaB/YqjD/DUF883 family membrane-anchored ribosome-binding protein